ncbi:MAG: response regulator [Deltaproteobacteria bacterium]|nr:response regulator [Deltaproteobacteria bacterium]
MEAQPRLLVVDDEPVVCQSCSRIFAGSGFSVDTTTDPFDGLQRASEGDFSMVLLDVKMPGMEGIEFLERLRRANPDVPVIMITGYSSVAEAAAAMRLGAVDYIPKPFTPKELTNAVQRGLASHFVRTVSTTARTVPALRPANADTWAPSGSEIRYLDEAWVQDGMDGTVRVGAYLSPDEAGRIESVHLPRAGDTLERGLPLLSFTLQGGQLRVVPSPVSGEVTAINPALSGAAAGQEDLFSSGWVATIRGHALAEDVALCRTRNAVVASAAPEQGRKLMRLLEHLGVRVQAVAHPEEAGRSFERESDVLFFDAAAAGPDGPAVIRYLRESYPTVRVVVLLDDNGPGEPTYRELGVFYVATGTFSKEEAMSVIASVFRRPGEGIVEDRAWSSVLPPEIHRIQITDREGRTASLLASGGLLERPRGLGWMVVRKLLEAGRPVTVTHGTKEIRTADLLREARDGRVLLLETRDMGRVPGTLMRTSRILQGVAAGEPDHLVPCLVVQPRLSASHPLELDPRVLGTLADQILASLGA